MDHSIRLIFIGSVLLSASIIAGFMSSRLGTPLLLTFLAVGLLFGEEGPGGIVFNDMSTAYFIGSLSLAVILFDGGLRTPFAAFRKSLWPAFLLSTFGVFITAFVTGVAAICLFDMSWPMALLLGAILASTDAAAVFLLLHQKGVALRSRVITVLEVESGINDPMAIFLTILFVGLLQENAHDGAWGHIREFAYEMGGGAALGYAGGKALILLVNRLPLTTGHYPVMVLAGSLLIFSGTALLGASGFLAVYLAGLIVGNARLRKREIIVRFYDGMAWLAQIGMFIMIGLLVTPSQLWSQVVPGCLIALTMIFIARPLAVGLCLLPFRMGWRENVFISWVGLRGAVPIFLALIPTLAGLETDRTIFNVAFITVVVSLLLQGWSVFPVARLLGLVEKPEAAKASV